MNDLDDDFNPEEDSPDDIGGFYDDDGNKLNPELVPKPSLCISCKHDNEPSQETLCTLTRLDQKDDEDFFCSAYEKI